MNKRHLLILAIVVFVLEITVLAVFGGFSSRAHSEGEVLARVGFFQFVKYEMGMADFQHVERWQLDDGTNPYLALNKMTILNSLLIDVLLVAFAFLATRKLTRVPGRLQSAFEIIVDLFRNLVEQTLGHEGRRHIPMLGSLFLFIWISNIIAIVPLTEEPTRDLNVPVGHMLAVLFVVHTEAIRVRGLKSYLKSYLDPFFIMAPLNIIGELAKGVSLSFRLFGNILGGSIIIMVISYLVKFTLLPVGLNMFFGLFVGTVQAFVFTMLAMTYIAVMLAE